MKDTTINIISDSDSFSDDDVPLNMIKMNGHTGDPNSYDSLCRHTIEACEFCDRISKNRFASLIHNVSHIIIPLLNQTVYQCPTCLYYFTSEKDLRTHSLKKHPEIETVAQTPLVNNEECWSSQGNASQSSGICITKELKPNMNSEITVNSNIEEDKIEPLKNRLVFEDDDLIFLDPNQLLNDLTTDCKVNIELFNTPWMNGDEFSGKSVHYDELVKPGVYRCKKCGKGFPVRYDAIVHESSHIKFKNSQVILCLICKKYLVGGQNDLRHHYLTFHRSKHEIHNVYDLKRTITEEEKKIFDSKVLSLCELCFSFCKNRSTTNYECLKTISEVGKRVQCDKCGLLFFEIKLVRRYVQRRCTGPQVPKKRKKTNEERLKTITNRFKMMKH